MEKNIVGSLAGIAGCLVVGGLVAAAGGSGSVDGVSLPLFVWCCVLAFVIQWLAFIPAYIHQSEHYFDLTGSLTYLALAACALLFGGRDPRAVLIGILVAVWAVRLGSFLFARVRSVGSDGRFRNIKSGFIRFLMAWTLQGAWTFVTFAAGLAAMTSVTQQALGWIALTGTGLWLCGFVIEVVADRQKTAFRRNPDNAGSFITTGLWAWSRHPNYFGEIVLWLGITIIAFPVLSGWQMATMISPVFVVVLLTRISGIPLLENRADRRWGDDPAYQAYKAATPVLILRAPGR